ncbi:MAG: hypothetical protein IJA66_03725 [Alistipes sp.]|nr:hypothetical protein [Alistipes sp.]
MGLKIYSSIINRGEPYADGIQKGLDGVPTDRVCGAVFCGTSDTEEYHALLNTLKSTLCEMMGRRVPVTLIPQYLLPNGGVSLEIYTLDGTADIVVEEKQGVCYGSITGDGESLLFIEGIPASDFAESVRHQSEEVFGKFDAVLSAHGFAADDIVRQWNYIGSIVSHRDGKQNYQEFNDARTCYYAKGKWQNGYPAATGIGASGEGIIVGGIAFKRAEEAPKGIYPIDNPLQVSAHVYSKRVLVDDAADAMKSTPKFERAKLIETERGACCFVSGTAAIRGEESMDASSARRQTMMTIENIDYLVSKENLVRHGCQPYDLEYRQLQVFVKNAEDYEVVRAVVEARYPQLSVVYSIADVCRRELLVEIEGILTT